MDKMFDKKEESDDKRIKNEKNANILCGISLFLYFITIVYKWIPPFDSTFYTINNILLALIVKVIYIIISIAPFTAYIIMIIVRIKYKNNKFGKILMIVYNLSIIIFTIWICIFLKQCLDGLNNWPG